MTPPANILSFDLGTRTGWAASDGLLTWSGYQLFQPDIRAGTRFLKFNAFVAAQTKVFQPKIIAYERLTFPHKSTAASHVYYGFLVVLEMRAAASEIRLVSFPTWFIKQVATGKGNATKEQMVAAARIKFPHKPLEDDNEADALWIMEAARAVSAGEIPFPVRKTPLRHKKPVSGATK